MNKVMLKNVAIGPGRPKVCVPVMKPDKEALISQIKKLAESKKTDLIEWRADYYEGLIDENRKLDEAVLLETLKEVSDAAGKTPVIFTYRTVEDGGLGDIDAMCYEKMLELVAASTYIDVIDVELMRGAELFLRAVRKIHSHHISVIGSTHDFEKTPSKDEMIGRLRAMQNMEADICKIAVMPKNKEEVFMLMDACMTMNERYAKQPIVAISMGREGAFSRLAGEFFGSAITFGSDDAASAPGQIDAGVLRDVLSGMHAALSMF
ncbi:MAG: type I 3-dehydroquinate dehydratase [Lachnospiraceae bacterium]|jgi:3-dehydroquinate dehydratase-1|nr:type I 3-dehydroquinate dehydratase [Lachnospiraceae bacterium]MBQ3967158.1 type I 3-dehydroquinate dehydratase [Lachnospiraceae bacterium]